MVSSTRYKRFILVAVLLNIRAVVAVDDDCIPLEDRFQQTVWESSFGRSLIGNLNTSGTVDTFGGNPLSSGSVNGTTIGGSYGVCKLLPGFKQFYCYGELLFEGAEESTITFAGLRPSTLKPGKLAITGGTGCYEGARGTFLVTPQDINHPFDAYLWELVPSPDPSQCKGVASWFNGAPIFELSVTGAYIGEVGVPGGAFLWANHELYAGSIDGDKVGESFGSCNLLPHAILYKCGGVIMFDGSDDFITFSGLAPYDVNGTEISVITGGTGCYEGETEGLELTRLHINEPGDYYRWEYVVNSPSASCKSLDQIFGNAPIFEDMTNKSSSLLIFNVFGERSLWYNAPLRKGSIEGEIVGYSNGLCSLLPAADVFMQCSKVFIFGDMGGIAIDGLVLDVAETGLVVITGGTGCFENTTGNIDATALEIHGTLDASKLELVSTTVLNDEDNAGTSNGQTADSPGTEVSPSTEVSPGTGSDAMQLADDSSPGNGSDAGNDSGSYAPAYSRCGNGALFTIILIPLMLWTSS